ncbi:glycosyl hydrolase family 28 protein [Sphingobacterium sp. SYP-B4668]|uniref:glycosyl hydrolase family 28 protein n=1 Tax=Sphingobacterium sp. SYP-B4668 TaxID=2996035 RepID=UPI0022DDD1AB|nr:glycosyl hydrolase family 28 protein [Sphingobacterium sp. SYP-B4668]
MNMKLYALILSTILINFCAAIVTAQEKQYISPNMYSHGTQGQRIQQAIQDAIATTGKVVIPRHDIVTNTNIWLIDEAILLPSNMELELNNCTIKLSDRCRDNFIRSANSGLGIADIRPLQNIKIVGVGNVLLEGASNPRATGDHNKSLSLFPKAGQSYGSDAGKPNENQKGGWRNHGIILAHVDGFEVSGIKMKDYHAHGLVLERASNGLVKNMTYDVRQSVSIAGIDRQILNQDGMGVRFGCKNIIIDNCRGRSGDDFINIGLTDTGVGAGEENVNVVSGSIYGGEADDIANIYLQNWQDFYSISHRAIRIMPIGKLKIQNVFIENMVIHPTSFRGLNVEYATNISGLFVRNVVCHQPVLAKGIRNASFRDIIYYGNEAAIDIENSDSVVVDYVKRLSL